MAAFMKLAFPHSDRVCGETSSTGITGMDFGMHGERLRENEADILY